MNFKKWLRVVPISHKKNLRSARHATDLWILHAPEVALWEVGQIGPEKASRVGRDSHERVPARSVPCYAVIRARAVAI